MHSLEHKIGNQEQLGSNPSSASDALNLSVFLFPLLIYLAGVHEDELLSEGLCGALDR